MTSPHHSDNFLRVIRKVESGSYEGNYTAHAAGSSASGAYQFITSTWIGAGGGKYAPTAAKATPDQQDDIAFAYKERILDKYRASRPSGETDSQRAILDALADSWYIGCIGCKPPQYVPPGNTLSVQGYRDRYWAAFTADKGSADSAGEARPSGPFPGTDVSVPGVLKGIDAIGAFFAALLEWETWRRVLQIVGGLILLAGGVVMMKPQLATKAALAAVGA